MKWYLNKAAADKGTARVTCEYGIVAECGPPGKATDEHFKNARLIAATPDLLEACRTMTEHLKRAGCANDSTADTILKSLERGNR